MTIDRDAESEEWSLLESCVTSVGTASAATDVFRSLLEASRSAGPRAAVFLFREGAFRGWGKTGGDARALRRLKALSIEPSEPWLKPLSSAEAVRKVMRLDATLAPEELGIPLDSQVMGVAPRVGGRVVAALVVHGGADETPWSPAALGILRTIAEIRLELDLLRRRLRPMTAATGPIASAADVAEGGEPAAPEPVPVAAQAVEAAPPPEPEPVAGADAVGVRGGEASLTPWLTTEAPEPESPRHEEARRFARLVATDIRLYHEEAILLGRRNRDLARRLAEPIERGRETFERRFSELGVQGRELLRDAYVQVLAGGDPTLIPDS